MARKINPTGEQKNVFVDYWVKRLLPEIEKASTLDGYRRKAGMDAQSEGERIKGWRDIADDLFKGSVDKYPDSEDKGYRQAKAVAKKVLAVIQTDLEDKALVKPATNTWRSFNSHLNDLYRPFKKEVRADYQDRVVARKSGENKIEIDLEEYLLKASEILNLAKNGTVNLEGVNWKDVSCALALVTGRRMGEIHCTANFEYASEYELKFSGRLKTGTASSRETVYIIPTLIPSKTCFDALNWLSKYNKRLAQTEDPMRVNAVYSKALSENIKVNWYIVDDIVWKEAEATEDKPAKDSKASMSYHKLRACYHAACKANWLDDESNDIDDYQNAARNWLADDRDASVESYKRLNCKRGSITKI